MAVAGDTKSDDGSPNPATLALRIATVALSVASTALMASANCTAGCAPANQVSYTDYGSLKYVLVATIMAAAAQAVAAWMKASGKEGWSKAVKAAAELIDTASQTFLYSSSALSFSVEDFGTCGHRVAGVCKGSEFCFCQRTRMSGAVSMAAAVALSVSKYLEEVPISTWFKSDNKKPDKHNKGKTGCGHGGHCHHV
ncbi:hypothetical protein HU200_054067 [Digitaria exilis]|uniref:CASP-like protein n=1 Tax=Digitaria exilis TaxID=1010633 RepID=A0A835E2X9_9POAL|nr:hypothetical protein HU200_054067 [Digitaria exilis]CAB3492145.1 unnamed protein product [Digitaria exilis]